MALNMIHVTVVIATFISTVWAITLEDCPENLKRDKYLQVRGNYCYRFMTYKSLDFEHAQRDCRSQKGNLATVRDKDTQTYLYSMLRTTYGEDDPVWIGLTDENSEGVWEWQDGSPAVYTNWDDGQPGIGSGLENCAAINMEHHGKWHDYRCNDLLFIGFDHTYVCEYGPVGITTGTPTTTRVTGTTTIPTTVTTIPTTVTTIPTTVTTTPTSTTTDAVTTATTTPTSAAPTTHTTTSTTTTQTTTPTAATTATTTPQKAMSTTCPPFVCPNLSCGLDGYKQGPNGCTLCECDV